MDKRVAQSSRGAVARGIWAGCRGLGRGLRWLIVAPYRLLARMGWFRENAAVVVPVSAALVMWSIAWPTLNATHEVSPAILPIYSALAALPLAFLVAQPFWALMFSLSGAVVVWAAADPLPGTTVPWPWQIPHALVIFSLLIAVAVREPGVRIVPAWAATGLVIVAGTSPRSDGVGWAVGITVMVIIGLLLRWLIASRAALARQAEATEWEKARRQVLEERGRIARELHDVVAHHMSMIVVQADSARYRHPGTPEPLVAEFADLAGSARQALNEIRGMLGVLRSDAEAAPLAPQPSVEDIPGLVASARRAGVAVAVTVRGEPGTLSVPVGQSLYRIVQESLTNATRHAPGAPVSITLDYSLGGAAVSVSNPVPGAGSDPDGSRALSGPVIGGGHGIRGMRERAAAVGGAVEIGADEGQFRVAARFIVPARPNPVTV